MECAHGTVLGFNAHYNKWDTLTNLELLLEGLYRIIVNVLESAAVFVLISAAKESFSLENRILLFFSRPIDVI